MIAIIDYGTGNVSSIGRALNYIGHQWELTRLPARIAEASHIILPGVGHGGQAMKILKSEKINDVLNDVALIQKTPILGICLGMQLMTAYTEEGNCNCLGWFSHRTVEINPRTPNFKVPNIGWHTIESNGYDPLLEKIDLSRDPFYFCHKYGIRAESFNDATAVLNYGGHYAAVLRKENMIGVQFHPEKSQDPGIELIKNFLNMRRRHV